MEMRKLKSTDIFTMSQIIKKFGVEEFKDCFTKPETMKLLAEDKGEGINADKIGFNIMFDMAALIIGNLPKCKEEIYKFLSDLTGEKKETIEDMPMDQFAELIIELIQKEDFKDFIKVVSKLFK